MYFLFLSEKITRHYKNFNNFTPKKTQNLKTHKPSDTKSSFSGKLWKKHYII